MAEVNGFEKRKWTDLSDAELREELHDTHIWVNAFSCVNPTEEFKAQIGGQIIKALATTRLIDHFGISPTILIRVNKS